MAVEKPAWQYLDLETARRGVEGKVLAEGMCSMRHPLGTGRHLSPLYLPARLWHGWHAPTGNWALSLGHVPPCLLCTTAFWPHLKYLHIGARISKCSLAPAEPAEPTVGLACHAVASPWGPCVRVSQPVPNPSRMGRSGSADQRSSSFPSQPAQHLLHISSCISVVLHLI